MSAMLSMSWRLGIDPILLQLGDPVLEERPRVVRSGPGLRVELHRARAQIGELEALDRAVVERDVRGLPGLGGLDREAVVLARHEDGAGWGGARRRGGPRG